MMSRHLESVLGGPHSTLETVNPDRSAAERRNMLNVFNSIEHVRRGPEAGEVAKDGPCMRRGTGAPGRNALLLVQNL